MNANLAHVSVALSEMSVEEVVSLLARYTNGHFLVFSHGMLQKPNTPQARPKVSWIYSRPLIKVILPVSKHEGSAQG